MKKILVIVAITLVAILILSACQGPAGPQEPPGPQAPVSQVRPATQNLSIIMGEGEIIQEVNGEEALTGEFHRLEPATLVVNKGDKVVLTVTNSLSHTHSFTLPEFGVTTPSPEPRGGTATVEFIADKVGVFQFACATPYDKVTGDCGADHERQVGYLIVMPTASAK